MFLKEIWMSANVIFPVYKLNHDILSESSGIMIINADKTPPHLGVFSKSKYFSISVNDIYVGTSIEVMIQYIHRKRIPTVFIRLKNEIEEKELYEIFNSFEKLEGQCTCIEPIKKIFSNKISEADTASFIFELIPMLKANGWLRSFHHLYSEHLIADKTFTLSTYTMDDVMNRINLLVNDKR